MRADLHLQQNACAGIDVVESHVLFQSSLQVPLSETVRDPHSWKTTELSCTHHCTIQRRCPLMEWPELQQTASSVMKRPLTKRHESPHFPVRCKCGSQRNPDELYLQRGSLVGVLFTNH